MTDAEFAGLFNTVTANKKVFVINANYAGGFLTALNGGNTTVEIKYDNKYFGIESKND